MVVRNFARPGPQRANNESPIPSALVVRYFFPLQRNAYVGNIPTCQKRNSLFRNDVAANNNFFLTINKRPYLVGRFRNQTQLCGFREALSMRTWLWFLVGALLT